jgi:DNA-binding SARP family transcriptional activator
VASSKLEVKLFGGIAVSRGSATLGARDFGGTKAKQLFQLLVLARGEPMPKDRLADLIWGESLPVHVNATLETYVSVLRRKLSGVIGDGRGLITTEHEAYALPTAGYELDLARFDELVRQADAAEPSARRRCLEDALALATGSVLADEPYSDWAIDERWRYERRIVDTAIAASSLAMQERDARSALAHAERAIAVEPLDERGYHAGLLALQALGRDRDAIALYDRCCALIEDAEAPPVSDVLRELRATIGRREAINLPPRAEAPARVSHGSGSTRSNAVRLLGRSAELDVLSRAFEATRDGGSELVLIEGELGIGKTTLLAAASRELEGVGLGWTRCSELVSGIPYAAIALALREVLGTSTVDVRDYPALALVFPEMRVRSTSAAPRTVDALEALVALVEALAPLVLILDDLHWADADTLVALDYLASRGPLRGVTLAGAVRPEEISSGHRVAQLRPTMRIPLGALDESDLAPLGIADLYHRTEGHPLFVSLAVRADDGRRRSRSEVVGARCRGEGDVAYRLLSAACLLEESFSASRLAGVLGMTTANVAHELDRLCHRRLLLLHDGHFRFRTRLMREAMADSLSPASRTLLEQRISRDGPAGPNGKRPEDGGTTADADAISEPGTWLPHLPRTNGDAGSPAKNGQGDRTRRVAAAMQPKRIGRSRPAIKRGLAS